MNFLWRTQNEKENIGALKMINIFFSVYKNFLMFKMYFKKKIKIISLKITSY